jgi:hypothetical protein
MSEEIHFPATDSVHGAPAPKKSGRPPEIDEYARGKLLVCLALGYTEREAAAWVGAGRTSVRTAQKQEEFNEDLKNSTTFARLHPLLRMYQSAGESWKPAARLLIELDKRLGPLSTDELAEGIALVLNQANASRRASRADEPHG